MISDNIRNIAYYCKIQYNFLSESLCDSYALQERRFDLQLPNLKPQVVKKIYKTVFEKLIQYGSEIWYKDIVKINNKLIQIQRQPLLGITETYRTVSNEAIQVLNGCPPLDLKIRIENGMDRQIRRNKLNKIIDDKINFEYEKRIQPWKTLKIDWNHYMEEMKGLMIFTDGSKMDVRVGCAFVVFYNKTELDYRKFRLNDLSTVFMAKVIAIQQAVQYVKANYLGQVNIISDSRSALMALSAVEEDTDIINNIKEDIKEYKGKITLTWIRAHIGNFGNERADQLAKDATLISDETISFVLSGNQTRNEGNKIIKDLWQNRWNDSKNARWTKNLIDKVNVDRLYVDFYLNQILTAHGVFREHETDVSCH
ncbi:hypothetical protein AVEN_177985-1 [Araneus ventricosus]|uniref:ribonuclease H n=1 Tax=Araneus ventricosus TaxID=182803 RepID=A0A4Y2EIZ0_ARAVE|nr:hypothetical protein AVEN_177985-1 [Araneus ventricosus]